jgi:hypothetical protein
MTVEVEQQLRVERLEKARGELADRLAEVKKEAEKIRLGFIKDPPIYTLNDLLRQNFLIADLRGRLCQIAIALRREQGILACLRAFRQIESRQAVGGGFGQSGR